MQKFDNINLSRKSFKTVPRQILNAESFIPNLSSNDAIKTGTRETLLAASHFKYVTVTSGIEDDIFERAARYIMTSIEYLSHKTFTC